MNIFKVCFIALSIQASILQAEDMPMNHSAQHSMISTSNLSEAGNDAFGTIQELIGKLNHDSSTDWSKVNIEALRQHLVDMYEMTINVEVLSQENLPRGFKTVVRPINIRAMQALDRVFSAHPAQLKQESGWDMQVKKEGEQFILTITTEDIGEVHKIRGLGYIGTMAYGNHHQPHHWAMATGSNPHTGHHH